MACRYCFSCGFCHSSHWAGDIHVVECRGEEGSLDRRLFQPFDRMICDRWMPRCEGEALI